MRAAARRALGAGALTQVYGGRRGLASRLLLPLKSKVPVVRPRWEGVPWMGCPH